MADWTFVLFIAFRVGFVLSQRVTVWVHPHPVVEGVASILLRYAPWSYYLVSQVSGGINMGTRSFLPSVTAEHVGALSTRQHSRFSV